MPLDQPQVSRGQRPCRGSPVWASSRAVPAGSRDRPEAADRSRIVQSAHREAPHGLLIEIAACANFAGSQRTDGGQARAENMGQRGSKPELPPAEPQAPTRSHSSGLTPRNRQARRCCNLRSVRSLVRRGRLAPCWRQLPEGEVGVEGLLERGWWRGSPLRQGGRTGTCTAPLQLAEPAPPVQGRECPVCCELFDKLNLTACCHQELCKCPARPGCVRMHCLACCRTAGAGSHAPDAPCYATSMADAAMLAENLT